MKKITKAMKLDFEELANKLKQSDSQELINLSGELLRNKYKKSDAKRPNLGCVGIWLYDEASEKFILNQEVSEEWRFWNNQYAIEKYTKADKRIVFLGESSARGYFYDPEYTPSIELKHLLEKYAQEEYEVVDLAKTDLTHERLIELIEAVVQLKPDEVILYSGNNWNASALWNDDDIETKLTILSTLKYEGLKGLERLVETYLSKQVQQFYEAIKDQLISAGIDVTIIVPDYNVFDWKNEDTSVVSIADAGEFFQNKQLKQLKKWNAEKNYDEIIKLGEQFTLENVYHIEGLNYIAKAYLTTGNVKLAEKVLRRINDISHLFPQVYTPRIHSIVQGEMATNSLGIKVIQLTELIERNNHIIADKTVFLDYCHLSRIGIQVLTTEICRYILKQEEESIESYYEVSEQVESEAEFLAAIHNAHWGQSEQAIQRHLQRSIEINSDYSERTFKEFIDFQHRKLPYWMSSLSEPYLKNLSRQKQRYLTMHNGLSLNIPLLRVMNDLLKNGAQDSQMGNNPFLGFQRRRLLNHEYYLTSIDRKEAKYDFSGLPDKMKRYGYYRSFQRSSFFYFNLEEVTEVLFQLVSRNRMINMGTEFSILLNGNLVCQGDSTVQWKNFSFEVSEKHTNKGLNMLEIVWPDNNQIDVEKELQSIEESIRKNRMPDLHYCFGEIHDLSVELQFVAGKSAAD